MAEKEGLFSKLKSLVIEEEKPVVAAPAAPAPVSAPMGYAPTAGTGTVNTEFLGILTDAMTSQKTVYTTFKETADKIAGVIADEATRYKTAAASTGANKVDLLACIDAIGPVLDLQKSQFANNLNSTLGLDIQNLEMDCKELDTEIAELNAKLSALTESKLQKEKALMDSRAQFAGFTKDFDVTLASVVSNLDVERKKLDIYLGG